MKYCVLPVLLTIAGSAWADVSPSNFVVIAVQDGKIVERNCGDSRLPKGIDITKAAHVRLFMTGAKAPGDSDLEIVRAVSGLESALLNTQRITDRGLAHLEVHRNLRELHLTNRPGYSPPALVKLLKSLPRLETLLLQDGVIDDDGLLALEPLPQLKRLYIRNCAISDQGLAVLKRCQALESLRLQGCKLNGTFIEHVADLPLKSLEFDCPGADDKARAWRGLRQLETLSVGGGPLGAQQLACLGQLSELKSLTLYNLPGATDETMAAIKDLKKLERLNLGNVGVSDRGLDHLEKLPGLKLLQVQTPQVSRARLQKFAELRPEVNVPNSP